MRPGPIDTAAAGAHMKNIVRLIDEIWNLSFRIFLSQGLEFLIAEKTTAKELIGLRLQMQFVDHFLNLVARVIRFNDDDGQTFRFLANFPAPG